ncbi:MAG: hypothetical protein ABI443_07545 [Chthoniobacterales bacterium]
MTWRVAVILLGVLCLNLHAQNLGDERAKGLAFYKKQAFLPDANVTVYEYCYTRMDGRVLLVTTLDGTSMKVTENNDILFVPYPGRGEASFDEASTAIQTALVRFPQYSPLLKKITKAWELEQRRPATALLNEQNEAAKHHAVLDRFSRYLFSRANSAPAPEAAPTATPESLLNASTPETKENAQTNKTKSITDDVDIQALMQQLSDAGKKH